MHHEGDDLVVVVEIGVTKADVTIFHDGVQVSVFVKLEVGLEIELEIFEDKLNFAVAWKQPGVNLLVRVYRPTFERWEIEINELSVMWSNKFHIDIVNVKVSVCVSNISPLDIPLEKSKEHFNMI